MVSLTVTGPAALPFLAPATFHATRLTSTGHHLPRGVCHSIRALTSSCGRHGESGLSIQARPLLAQRAAQQQTPPATALSAQLPTWLFGVGLRMGRVIRSDASLACSTRTTAVDALRLVR